MMEAIFGPFLGHFSWISEENVSFHRTLRNSADSGIQRLEPTEQTKQASRTARFGDPKGRVNEDPAHAIERR